MAGLYADYLDPLPTTLDAKNSPLALLAQTCYNISKDDSAKVLIPPIEKKKDGRDSAKSTSPLGDRPYRLGSKSPKEKAFSPGKSIEPRMMKSPPKDKFAMRESDTKPGVESPLQKTIIKPGSRISTSAGEELRSNNSSSNKANALYSGLSVETNLKESHGASAHRSTSLSPAAAADGPPSTGSHQLPPSSKLLSGLYNHTGLLSPYYPSLGLQMYPGYALTNPSAAAASLLGAAGAAEHQQKVESSSHHQTVAHATVKTISGATTLVPVCSDPGCVQCRLAVQTAQYTPSSCSSGCTDCSREGSHRGGGGSSTLAGLSHLAGLNPLASRLHPSLYGSISSHQADVIRNGQHSPPSSNHHVCSWVANGKYCGERFSTSEELMTHLRSHTSSLDPALSLSSAALPSLYSSLAAHQHPALALSQLYGFPGTTPLSSLSSSASPLRSGGPYGRSLSPSSLLSSSRFHPYHKSPLSSHIPCTLPTGYPSAPPSLSSFPGLYSLPGSRLGPLVP